MSALGLLIGIALIVWTLWDAFETVVLPRRISRRLRFPVVFLVPLWKTYAALMRRMPPGGRRENYLSYYGPITNIVLLVAWAVGLIFGFALVLWGVGSPLSAPEGSAGFGIDLYMSGTTFFTLGLGDVAPRHGAARVIAIAEAGIGFAFLALVISYLPVIYQAFSRRELRVALLDAWAGSPPAAVELLRRLAVNDYLGALPSFLEGWEAWAAQTLESHIAYPNLCFYRSQHDNQSWLSALTTILDACALIMVGLHGVPSRGAALTFAMSRHAVVDLSQILNREPRPPATDRLPPADLAHLREVLAVSGIGLRDGREADDQLAQLRRQYEPYVNALSGYLLMPLPAWIPAPGLKDNWQKSRWK